MPPLRPLRPLRLLRLLKPTISRPSSSFSSRPSPPKLPAAQQAEFERLQRAAAVSSAFQDISPSQTPPSTENPRHATTAGAAPVKGDETSLNQGLFRGAPPEFEGDTNPKTGEVGGPKNEPLRWGGNGDWSYNGRVTDF
ncbi:hypothetical protein Trco_007274 [Trichoderma cornu-damae]|uniref:Succinate dehydrogenase assembly factor 4, mitochondrial n=1 Tax=Trichoderma cornu-damae TaxID=654480 RepID=A0A9P8QIZ8_9HYPO|nr:hypothetical protein Trco_007274 [Trichoderma cornu-damae]